MRRRVACRDVVTAVSFCGTSLPIHRSAGYGRFRFAARPPNFQPGSLAMTGASMPRRNFLPQAAVLMLMAGLLAGCGGADARRDRYIEKAAALVADENWEKASLEARNALQIDPNDNRARLLLGKISERMDDPRQAVQMYQSVLDSTPDDVDARAGLARLYALGGLPEKALEHAEAGLAQHPKDARLLTARAAARARLGQSEAAFADAQAAFAIDPDDPTTIALLASLHASAQRMDEAVRLLELGAARHPRNPDFPVILASLHEARSDRPAAAAALQKLVALDPANLPRRMLQVQFLLRGGEVDAAEQSLRAAMTASPRDVKPKLALAGLLATRRDFASGERELLRLVAESPRDLELQVGLADFYAAHGKRDLAVGAYRKVIAKDGVGPQGLLARNRLAAAALQAKDLAQAEQLVGEVLAENSQDNDALGIRADIALARGDATGAITDLRALLRDQPESVPAQRALARAYMLNGDTALAEQTVRVALERTPGDAQLQVDSAQLLLQAGKGEQARAALEDVTAREPGNLSAQELLFRLQASSRDLAGARRTAAAVKSARPELALGDYLLGLVERAENKNDAAVESFERALRLQPDAAEPLAALVELLAVSGRRDAALARLDRAIALRPGNAVALNLKAELLASDKRLPESIVVFGTAIRAAPDWWVPYRGQAVAHLLERNVEAAIASYRAGIAATDAPGLVAGLASLFEDLQRTDEAIALYDDMLRRDPGSQLAANNLAMLLVTYRSDDASLARAKELAARLESSQDPALLNTAGWVRFKAGDVNGALPLLQRAADGAPATPQLKYMLGMAQSRAGQRDAAIASLEAALTAGLPFAGMDEARETLATLKRS